MAGAHCGAASESLILEKVQSMNIYQFASEYRARVCRDESSDPILPGKHGDIFEGFENGLLGVCFITPATNPPRTGYWRKRKAAAISAGMVLRQEGDAEGVFSFDPTNPAQASLALKLAGVKRRRELSPDRRAAAIARLEAHRLKPNGSARGARFQSLETQDK